MVTWAPSIDKVALPLEDLTHFPRSGKKIAGVGMNYYALLTLLKANKPKDPVIFLKPPTAYIVEGQPIVIPNGFAVNEEIELGVVIGKRGKHIEEKSAMDYVGGYCVALDMTATSEMTVARSSGLPWSIGKGFDTSCPVSRFVAKEEIKDQNNVNLWCKVNGTMRQEGSSSDLIFSIPRLVSFISKYMTLEPNDLIITGSPPGMGPVVAGDVIEGGIKDVVTFVFHVEEE